MGLWRTILSGIEFDILKFYSKNHPGLVSEASVSPTFPLRVTELGQLGLGGFRQRLESVCVVDGHIGKNFAIQFNLSQFQAMHEFAVGQSLSPYCGVDPCDPKPPKLSLADFSIPVRIAQPFFN